MSYSSARPHPTRSRCLLCIASLSKAEANFAEAYRDVRGFAEGLVRAAEHGTVAQTAVQQTTECAPDTAWETNLLRSEYASTRAHGRKTISSRFFCRRELTDRQRSPYDPQGRLPIGCQLQPSIEAVHEVKNMSGSSLYNLQPTSTAEITSSRATKVTLLNKALSAQSTALVEFSPFFKESIESQG